jgi:hypothetical protein
MRDTIDMAREAELICSIDDPTTPWTEGHDLTLHLKAFEALVRADERSVEREACAKVCDDIGEDLWSLYKGRAPYTGKEEGRADMHVQGKSDGADKCAAAIRARGET